MNVFDSLDALPAQFGPSAVAIGKLDGLHRGHQRLLTRLVETAHDKGLAATVVTFDRNPLEVLAPQNCPRALMSVGRRVELIEKFGIDSVVVIPFTESFAARSAEWFAESVVADQLDARVVLAGEGFRFGRGGLGTLDLLREIGKQRGFTAIEVPTVMLDGEPVSSTAVRALLATGDVTGARALLGRPAEVSGLVVHGLGRGRELGFPTANLGAGADRTTGRQVSFDGFIPADGVYAGTAEISGADPVPAAISVGTNPTFNGVDRTVEAYLLDTDRDLYGQRIVLRFTAFLRPMVAFTGRAQLIDQMARDVDDVRALAHS